MKNALLLLGCITLLYGCSRKGGSAAAPASDSATVASDSTAPAVVPLSYEEQQGKDLYDRYCGVCHGNQGAGDGFNSYNLNPKPHSLADSAYVAALSDEELEQIIAAGGRGVNMSVEMPAYRGTLTKLEIAYVMEYVRRLAVGQQAK